MESDLESLPDQDMSSNSSSSRASTPTQPENFYSTCQKKKLIELELKTYTDSIDHTQILIKNLERQGLQNHPIYTNNCKMIQGLIHQRELLTVMSSNPIWRHLYLPSGKRMLVHKTVCSHISAFFAEEISNKEENSAPTSVE
ncbi:hypothetical protein NPIL_1201 [Nephila pilipes]|uniref:Uncharacterized protein n=1 Tax=Nephila pilipes TaxID=299642 RepID=A0A8X6NEA4_NEPPI|nr:hypothetical protein NPIL_1201 [Nephila pilipes]